MDYSEYGDKSGQPVVYFHGAPGSPLESSVFDSYAKHHSLRFICLDRFAVDGTLPTEDYYQQLVQQIKRVLGSQPIAIIGFSIGAQVALEVAKLLATQVRYTHLVSAAAPLDSGDFIEQMAGGAVFKLAENQPAIFSMLTQCQVVMARIAPSLLVNTVFASAAGGDRALVKRPEFRSAISAVLQQCFGTRARGYKRDIRAYVNWAANLDGYSSDVTLWHGTEDNWSPFCMSSALADRLPSAAPVQTMQGLSHYSCLYQAAPHICAQLSELEA